MSTLVVLLIMMICSPPKVAEAFAPPPSSSRVIFATKTQHHDTSSSKGVVHLRASLRDLVNSSSSPGGNKQSDDDEVDAANDYRSSSSSSSSSGSYSYGLSYSKYAANTNFRSRNIYGTGSNDMNGQYTNVDTAEEEERGLLNADNRISTFSFASNVQSSGSQGILSGIDEEENEEEEEDRFEEVMSAALSDDISTKEEEEEESTVSSKQQQETVSKTKFDYNKEMIADNHVGMVGINYSKRKSPFPTRERFVISDEKDERGLHSDRLGTFSFSSSSTTKSSAAAASRSSPSASAQSMKVTAGNIFSDEDDNNNFNDDELGVDNFHNNINVNKRDISDDASTNRRPEVANSLFDIRGQDSISSNGLDNHFDRLETFSKGQQQLVGDSIGRSTSFGRRRVPQSATGGGSSSSSDASRTSSSSLDDRDNHNDRLEAFSFGAAKPSSSSSSSGSTTDTNIKSTTEYKQSTTSKQDEEYSTKMIDKYDQVYSFGITANNKKGSLSSIASSVSIKTRNDRINEVKERTDPKRLHPDGMNVPRMNKKGDVMSFSNTGGKPNIFERIDLAKEEGAGEGGGNVDGGGASVEDKNVLSVDDEGYKGGNLILEKDDETDSINTGVSPGNGDCFIGFDLGTSGARMSIVERRLSDSEDKLWDYVEVATEALAWDDNMQYDKGNDWRAALDTLLKRVRSTEVMTRVNAICVSGTSATCLLVDRRSLEVSRDARMYNYDISSSSSNESAKKRVMELVDKYIPEKHTARATTGSLCKLLLWNEEQSVVDDTGEVKEVLCHQSDFAAMSLMQEPGIDNSDLAYQFTSDWHNVLKLGFDVRAKEFPPWMMKLLQEGAGITHPENVLPSKVISPGEPYGVISSTVATKYGLSPNCLLVGGTTDSNAAFFAAAGAKPDYGTAVTSLGSTLAMKQLSETFVEDASRGVYSHRFPRFGDDGREEEQDAWLIGGASNVGCAVLRQEGFSDEELIALSGEIDPNSDSSLSYYPLMKKGERFPVADSSKEPMLDPKPDSRKEYLHGILQAIGDVERDGFEVLGELGASPNLPKIVLSCGGGSKNDMWINMRERRLKVICDEGQQVEVKRAENTEASYGAALLAAASFE